jgi:hypothetical protein
MNVLDEVPQSHLHQRNLELDQTRYIIKTHDHESMDLEVANFFQKSKHFVRKKDMQLWILLFVPFHIKTSIAKDVELKNMVGALMDQSHDQEPRIHVI